MNFATFYADAIKERGKKARKGKFKGQRGQHGTSVKNNALIRPVVPYNANPPSSDAPSASTFLQHG